MQKKIVNLIVPGDSPHKLKRGISEIASIPHEPLRAVLSTAKRSDISQNMSSSVTIETAFAEIVVNTAGFAEKTRGHCGLQFQTLPGGWLSGSRSSRHRVIPLFGLLQRFTSSSFVVAHLPDTATGIQVI